VGVRRPNLFQLKPGTTLAQAKACWNGTSTVNPFLSGVLTSSTRSPSITTSVAYKLPSGTNVLFDFLDATMAGASLVTLHA
jgi:hypothetical protein